jgi:hypothetical protein
VGSDHEQSTDHDGRTGRGGDPGRFGQVFLGKIPAAQLNGVLATEPAGPQVTVLQAAEHMISSSDNTAADLLITLVGRTAVEAAAASSGLADPRPGHAVPHHQGTVRPQARRLASPRQPAPRGANPSDLTLEQKPTPKH